MGHAFSSVLPQLSTFWSDGCKPSHRDLRLLRNPNTTKSEESAKQLVTRFILCAGTVAYALFGFGSTHIVCIGTDAREYKIEMNVSEYILLYIH